MSITLDRSQLAARAQQIYTFMTGEHAPASEQLGAVDANPPSWGLDIDQWDWNPGVGVTSILDYFHTSRQPEVLDYLVTWVQRNRHKASKFQHVNVMAPFAIFPDLYRHTQDPFYRDTALEYGDWIVKNSARTSTGAFQHGGNLSGEIWADTIFMVVLFLARLSRLAGDTALAEEAAQQLLLHLQYLQDPQTGVLFHGYFCNEHSHKSGGRWTRGNGWITLATPLILAELQPLITVPAEIEQRYRRLAEGLLRFQAANGLWHTIMDRPDFYQETSGSAGIAAGILKSIRLGLLPDDYLPAVEKAIGGILQTATLEGCITGVSGGTPIMNSIEEYNRLTRYPTLYGQGLTLILLGDFAFHP